MAYDNTNKLAFWKNKQPKDDKSPHFLGTINVAGVEYDAALWWNGKQPDDSKKPTFSGSLKSKNLPEPTGYNDGGAPEDGMPF